MPKIHKKTVDWFPHPVRHGRKMAALEKRFGNDGFAAWFKILEELGGAEHHYITLACPHQVELLADRCLITTDALLQIIETLVRWGDFNASLWENHRALYSQKFISSLGELYRKRAGGPPTAEYIAAILEGAPVRDTAEPPEETDIPKIDDYSDIFAHHPVLVAQAITGENVDTNPRAVNAWKKYLRILSAEDPDRGVRMFRDVLKTVYADNKAGELKNPAAVLTKKLKEIAA